MYGMVTKPLLFLSGPFLLDSSLSLTYSLKGNMDFHRIPSVEMCKDADILRRGPPSQALKYSRQCAPNKGTQCKASGPWRPPPLLHTPSADCCAACIDSKPLYWLENVLTKATKVKPSGTAYWGHMCHLLVTSILTTSSHSGDQGPRMRTESFRWASTICNTRGQYMSLDHNYFCLMIGWSQVVRSQLIHYWIVKC